MSDELKPCPFCGNSPVQYEIEPHEHGLVLDGKKFPASLGHHIIECGCGVAVAIDESKDAVVARWNKRPHERSATAAAIERCAKVAEPQSKYDDPLTAWQIAKDIRALLNTEKEPKL